MSSLCSILVNSNLCFSQRTTTEKNTNHVVKAVSTEQNLLCQNATEESFLREKLKNSQKESPHLTNTFIDITFSILRRMYAENNILDVLKFPADITQRRFTIGLGSPSNARESGS